MKKIKDFFIVLFGGPFGVHKFVNGEFGMGILYLFTGGIFLIGWLKSSSVIAKVFAFPNKL